MDQQILISGGGVPGLVLAILLGQEGIQATVIDPVKPPRLTKAKADDGHTTALMQSSLDILSQTGVLDDIRARCGRMNALKIMDVTGAEAVEQNFDSLEIDQESFGLNIPVGVLRAALAEKAASLKSVTIHFGRSLMDYTADPHGVTARLDNKKELRGALLVGADGRKSVVRAVARIDAIQKDYGQDALTFLVAHSKDHQNISTELHRPGGPLTFVPLGEKTSSVVWVEKRATAKALHNLKTPEFQEKLQKASRDVLGGVTLQSAVSRRGLILMAAQKLTAQRVALMAEAAHALHPMGAQGLNLSLRDSQTLADLVIDQCCLGLDPGATQLLKKYERSRRVDIAGRVAATHGLVKSLTHTNPALHKARRAGLKILASISPLKTILMRAGMTGRTFGT